MHAWLCTNPTGVEALTWTELPTPTPKAGEVLIEIKAASLNFPDLLIVQNKYQMKPPLPFVPGSEYAGVVAAVGEGVTHLKVGQNVACLSGTGGFGTHTVAPAALCMPLPDGFSHVDAAAFIMIYATSHHALVDRARLKAGETIENREGGNSMTPRIKHRQPVTIAPVDVTKLERGDVVYVKVRGTVYTHLVVGLREGEAQIGNNHGHVNGWTSLDNVFGIVIAVDGVPVGGAQAKVRRPA